MYIYKKNIQNEKIYIHYMYFNGFTFFLTR